MKIAAKIRTKLPRTLCLAPFLPFLSVGIFLHFGSLPELLANNTPKNDKPKKEIKKSTPEKNAANLAKQRKLALREFGTLVTQHNGRLKPLDTLARHYLLAFHGKSKIRDSQKKISAIEWLASLVFEPQSELDRLLFSTRNPEVLDALKINWRKNGGGMRKHYSYDEISSAMAAKVADIEKLANAEQKTLSSSQKQTLRLYQNLLRFVALGNAFSAFAPSLAIENDLTANILDLPKKEAFSLWQMLAKSQRILSLNDVIRSQSEKPEEIALQKLLSDASAILANKQSRALRIFPPTHSQSNSKQSSPKSVKNDAMVKNTELWLSPWEFFNQNRARHREDDTSRKAGELLSEMPLLWREKKYQQLREKIALFKKEIQAEGDFKSTRIMAELWQNRLDLFTKSLAFYLLAFLLLLAGFLSKQTFMIKLARITIYLGLATHFIGLILRVYIMARPPVATLYESIIFVALVAVALCMLFDKFGRRRDHPILQNDRDKAQSGKNEKRSESGEVLLLACFLGVPLQLVARSYATDGDTMGMLVAVLNSNFWLTTHVLSITLGYGCALVAGVMAHFYLLQRLRMSFNSDIAERNAPNRDKIAGVGDVNGMRRLMAASILALLFTIVGTILGGIWADQSWGRFWGWDPKENGALLIILWLLVVLHARVSRQISDIATATALGFNTITVVLAWFGVNLLNVGLHSYGFTEGAGRNLLIFCVAETIILFALFFTARIRLRSKKIV